MKEAIISLALALLCMAIAWGMAAAVDLVSQYIIKKIDEKERR